TANSFTTEKFRRPAVPGRIDVDWTNAPQIPKDLFEAVNERDSNLSRRSAALSPFDLLTGNCSVERAEFLSAGGFDQSLRTNEDFEFALRLQDRGITLRYCPDAAARELYERRSDL